MHSLPNGSNIDVLQLTVTCPDGVGRVGLGLTPGKLKSAIEFLSTTPPTDDTAQTLITCPPHYQTDAMCIVTAHLSSIIEEDVEDLLKAIDTVEELHSMWKGEATVPTLDEPPPLLQISPSSAVSLATTPMPTRLDEKPLDWAIPQQRANRSPQRPRATRPQHSQDPRRLRAARK